MNPALTPTLTAALLFLVATLTACPDEDPPDDPCAQDPAACGSNPEATLPEDPSCALSGDLTLELGWGEDRFHPMTEAPEVHYGAQGGKHIFHAVRVHDAEVDTVRQVRIQLSNYLELSATACSEAITSARQRNPSDLPASLLTGPYSVDATEPPVVIGGPESEFVSDLTLSRCVMAYSSRVVILGGADPFGGPPLALKIDADGVVHEESLLLQLPYSEPGVPVHLVFDARDACGRVGATAAIFVEGP